MSQPPKTEGSLTDLILERLAPFPHSHFLSAGDLNAATTPPLLDLADAFVDFNRQSSKSLDLMRGRTVMNLFFENSTRTSASFEIAAKRLGADVTTLSPRTSSTAKGETLIDTAATPNAMKPDVLVVRHGASGAAASYVMARQMGGDAPLMAGVVALTTVVSAFTIPILLGLFGYL